MARPKKSEGQQSNLQDTLAALNKKYNLSDSQQRTFISTGSIGLDKALGGGVITGRITELIAWEGVGKTTVSLHIVANAQKQGLKVAYIDSEHALDETYARALGVDWDELILIQPSFGEEAFEIGEELLKTGEVDVLIFDSTSGMFPKAQFEGDPGSSYIGKHAMLFSKEVPKINVLASKYNAVVIFISQLREKIGVMYGSPEITQAGNTLKFFASNRIELRKKLIYEGDVVVGQTTKFKVIKCKTHKPYGVGEFKIEFGKGIDKIGEIIDILQDLDIIKKWGKTITVFSKQEGEPDEKLEYDEFYKRLETDSEYYSHFRNLVLELYEPKKEITYEHQ